MLLITLTTTTMEDLIRLTNGNTLRIVQDQDAESPRECSNLGTMVCFHNRYRLGDKHSIDSDDYNGWDEMEAAIIRDTDVAVILPLYLYDHSGITISTTPFNCRWDSGQVGFIFITKEKVRKEYSVKRITQALKEKITSYLEGEVETYNKYLTGDTYGFIMEDENGEEIDSCWGFYGSDPKENGIFDHAGITEEEILEETI